MSTLAIRAAEPARGRTHRGTFALVSDHRALRRLVARVDADEVAASMVAAFRESIPGYRRLPETLVTNLIAEIARSNVELCFSLMPEGRLPQPEDLLPFERSARDRAAEGMPLEDLLHAYRLGGRFGWEALVATADPDETSVLLVAAERLMTYVDIVSGAVARAYLDETQHLVSEEERKLRDLFDTLASGATLNSSLRALCGRLGLPEADRYQPFVQTVVGATSRHHADLAADLRRRGALALTEGERVAGIAAEESQLRAEPGALLAVGEPVPRAHIPAALARLRVLLELSLRRELRGRVTPADMPLEMLLAAAPAEAQALAASALDPLDRPGADRSGALAETLSEFLTRGMDRRSTAEALHVHPNTLDYRLRRVRELTGLDPGRPQELAVLVLALTQRSLQPSG
jgi:hypothetical protein